MHYEDIKTILNRIDGVSNEASTSNRKKLQAGMNHIENILNSIGNLKSQKTGDIFMKKILQIQMQ